MNNYWGFNNSFTIKYVIAAILLFGHLTYLLRSLQYLLVYQEATRQIDKKHVLVTLGKYNEYWNDHPNVGIDCPPST